MSDLAKALAAIGESVPEIPPLDPRRPLVADVVRYCDELEAILLRLARRVADAERCRECIGTGLVTVGAYVAGGEVCEATEPCAACHGTGKEAK